MPADIGNSEPVTGPEHMALCGDDMLSSDVLNEIAQASQRGLAVLMATGAAYERADRLIEKATEAVAGAGGSLEVLDVLNRQSALDDGLAKQVSAASCVWIAGPSALHIRATLKDTPVLKALGRALQAGSLIVGSGGGATCLADPMVDARGGAFTVGLGLVKGLTIVSGEERQTSEYRKRSASMAPDDVVFVYLPLASALLHKQGQWIVSGDGIEAWLAGSQLNMAELAQALPSVAAVASADN